MSRALSPGGKSYIDHVERLERQLQSDEALRRAVGGEFVATGKLEYHLLRACGLGDDHLLVDVGCGSGRLACQLVPFGKIRYIGSDVVPKLLEYARLLCGRPDWVFECTDGVTIPCPDIQADFVCFFSVFTHLRQEDIFRYLCEAYRVLKPGGLVVLSFLEFRLPTHWSIFMASVKGTRDDDPLNQFIEREALYTLSDYSGFDVRRVFPGDTEYIPIPEEIRFEGGARMNNAGSLGQSVAVLQKREACRLVLSPAKKPESLPNVQSPALDPSTGWLDPTAAAAPIRNASARCFVTQQRAGMLGFTVGGAVRRRVLVRAIGPSLRDYGVGTPVMMPLLGVRGGDADIVSGVSAWGGAPDVVAASGLSGAFPLSRDNADAAVVLDLSPGSYTAVVRSGQGEGEVLIEMYLVG